MLSDAIYWIKDLFGGRWRSGITRNEGVRKARKEFFMALRWPALATYVLVLAKLLGLG